MGSTAGHDLDPAYVLTHATALTAANKTAHIDLESGLNEREEAGSHSNGNVLTEYLGENALYHNLTRSIGKILINYKRLVLEEGALVTRVGGLISVHASGVNESVGGLMLLHISYASAREVGTQTELLISLAAVVTLEPICIHTLSCGMVRGEVKVIECVVHYSNQKEKGQPAEGRKSVAKSGVLW